MNRNSNIQVRITTADDSWVETHRNSFGGFANMLDRVATRIDGTNSPRPAGMDDDGADYRTRGGVEFRVNFDIFTDADRVN